jgi:hypothetical protein
MGVDLTIDQPTLRATDSNSLLRMYDLAKEISGKSRLQGERARADKAIQRIGAELRKRNVSLSAQ